MQALKKLEAAAARIQEIIDNDCTIYWRGCLSRGQVPTREHMLQVRAAVADMHMPVAPEAENLQSESEMPPAADPVLAGVTTRAEQKSETQDAE